MTDQELYDHPGWRWCTAEGAREQVLRVGSESTFREQLEWPEEAETLSLRLQDSRESFPSRLHRDTFNADQIMNESIFVGVYPGLTAPMLEFMVETVTASPAAANGTTLK